jgi:hypothetical protein
MPSNNYERPCRMLVRPRPHDAFLDVPENAYVDNNDDKLLASDQRDLVFEILGLLDEQNKFWHCCRQHYTFPAGTY